MGTDRVRNVLSFAVLCGFTLMLAGTSKSKSTSPTPVATTATPTVPDPTVPTIANDVDINKIIALVNCKPPNPHAACRLITDFQAGDGIVDVPVGKIVWYGDSVGLGGAGDGSHEPFFLTVESSPTGLVGSARALITSDPKAKKDANDLIAANKQGKTVANSPAAAFMKTAAPPSGNHRIIKTTGKSSTLAENSTATYMRKIGNRLIVLEYDGNLMNHGGTTNFANAWLAETFILK